METDLEMISLFFFCTFQQEPNLLVVDSIPQYFLDELLFAPIHCPQTQKTGPKNRVPERTIKKAEHQRIDAFELWCWRRLPRVPWTARRSDQSILKEVNPEYSLEGLRLKVKLQYFGHLMSRANSLEKTLMLGKTEGRRRG